MLSLRTRIEVTSSTVAGGVVCYPREVEPLVFVCGEFDHWCFGVSAGWEGRAFMCMIDLRNRQGGFNNFLQSCE